VSENAEFAFDGFVNAYNNPNRTLIELDLTHMPLSHNLFLKISLFFQNQNPNYDSSYTKKILLHGNETEYTIESDDESDLNNVSFRTEDSDIFDRIDDLDLSYIKRFSDELEDNQFVDLNNNSVEYQKPSKIIIDFSIENDELVSELGRIIEFKNKYGKKDFKLDLVINKLHLLVYPTCYKKNFFKIFSEKNLVILFFILFVRGLDF
jgi:hypothetical protein